MITVKELKKMLKGYPDDLLVCVSMHDNGAGEIAGYVSCVDEDTDAMNNMKCLILQC